MKRRLGIVLILLAAGEARSEERRVTASHGYAKGGLHRFVFGADYRDLWTTPIRVEILDVRTFAGGLKATFRVGGQQTKGLALKGQDGRDYTFRGLEKDASDLLPENLLGTVAETILQDQGAAQHPAAALIADPIMEAAGTLHADTRLVVLPDDPALGEFRADFAGLLGTLAEYPGGVSATNPGFRGATEIIKHKDLYARLEASAKDRVDSRALLKARLVDLMIGDWDRHRDQWRWARLPGQNLWQPIADDRDQAFCRYEGALLAFARNRQPILQSYGRRYPGMTGLTWNGREQDRFLLTDLEWSTWKEVAAELKSQITGEVIERAARRMPPEYFAMDGARLIADLRARRDQLPEGAARFYRHLAEKVDVYLTKEPERVEVDWLAGGAEVRAFAEGAETPYYRRHFLNGETREVRIHLRGGDDRVVTTGRRGPILIRAIEGDGSVRRLPSAQADTRPYTPPPGPKNAPWVPARDWGRVWYRLPYLGYSSDLGLLVGAVVDTRGFAFRKHPFGNRHVVRGAFAFGATTGRAEYRGEYRRENSRAFTTLEAYGSGVEVLRFYGLGNDTPSTGPDDFYKVFQRQVSLRPALTLPLAANAFVSVGPIVKYSTTDRDRDAFVNATRPYGTEDFGQAGLSARLSLETRRPRDQFPAGSLMPENGYPTGGVFVSLGGTVYPEVWNVKRAFGSVEGTAATYFTAADRATFALRAGGKKVFGTYPFHEAAYLGGGDTLRGLRVDRFAGDASLYGNAELRLYLSRFRLVLPGEWGVYGFGDGGRVYREGERSDTWHTAFGGGLWFAYLDRKNTVTISVARSEERTGVYFRAGFVF